MTYEYHGLMAETWDWLRGDPSGRDDREFYEKMIEVYGQPVLDAGCGTGRLLLDFLTAGIDIEGVDVSPEMLALCRAKSEAHGLMPVLYEQSLEALALPRKYQTILAPSSVLQLITNPVAVREAIARLYAHLIPGGALITPFMTLWREGMPLEAEWETSRIREADGAMLHRIGRVWYDPVTECEHTEDFYQIFVDGEMVAAEHHRRSPASRSYNQAQAKALFESAGFVDIRLLHGFTQDDALSDDALFTVVGVKPLERGSPETILQALRDMGPLVFEEGKLDARLVGIKAMRD